MPDDEKSVNHNNSFDQEPATGDASHSNLSEKMSTQPQLESSSEHERTPTSYHNQSSESHSVSQVAEVTDLPKPGPGVLVLQWLVYALWGWTVLVLSGLIALVVNTLLQPASDGWSSFFGGGIAYLLAAAIVLFIIALVCDIFYSRAERRHSRSNGANVIMIIHAVIFALFGIGALITSVFGGVQLLIGETVESAGAVGNIITGAVVFVLYGLTLLRVLRPRWIKAVPVMYWLLMSIALFITVVLSVMGPVAQERLRNADKIVEEELPALVEAINYQTGQSGRLPRNLDEVSSYDLVGTQKQRNDFLESMVTYTPGKKLTSSSRLAEPGAMALDDQDKLFATPTAVYLYQVCVEYKSSTGDEGYSPAAPRYDENRYETSVSTYEHKAGRTCYDVQTDYLY